MELLIVFAVNVLTAAIRRWIFPLWGRLGVQVIAFALAFVGALYYTYADAFPAFKTIILSALGIFSMAVAFYEVIFSRVEFFSSDTKKEELAGA